MKIGKFIGIVALFATLGLGMAGYNESGSVSAKTVTTKVKRIKAPAAYLPVTLDGVRSTVLIKGTPKYFDSSFLIVGFPAPYIKGYVTKESSGSVEMNSTRTGWKYGAPIAYTKLKISSSNAIKKSPVRIKSKAYNVYAYPRVLKSNSTLKHYGKSNHSTTFYITKTIKLNSGESYSWLVNGSGKAYGYINARALGAYVKPKTDKVNKKHTAVRVKSNAYDVYSYPKALHGNSKFMHYGKSYHSTTFFISKNVTTASNVKYSKLTYANGKLYGYINAKALKSYTTVKNVKTVSSKTKYRVSSAKHNIYNAPSDTAYGVKTTRYGKNYLKTNLYVTKTETRVQDDAKFSYVKTAKNNLGWIYSGYLKAQK